jgi:hypothetical protein
MKNDEIAHAIGSLQAKMEILCQEVLDLKKSHIQLLELANRWKGGILILLAVGGLIGWLADKLLSVFHK